MNEPITITDSNDTLLGIIIRSDFSKDGITFFTQNDSPQQIAFMKHPEQHTIVPHIHNKIERKVYYTQETLFLRKGRLRCDFYDKDKKYIRSEILNAGDIIFLASGGHGFKCLEPVEMIEIKQGPYAEGGGDKLDKTRFDFPEENIICPK